MNEPSPRSQVPHRTLATRGIAAPTPAVKSDRVFAVSYLRVSTEDQAREGFSLDAQQARIRAYCAAKGYILVRDFVDDGQSGRTTNRAAF